MKDFFFLSKTWIYPKHEFFQNMIFFQNRTFSFFQNMNLFRWATVSEMHTSRLEVGNTLETWDKIDSGYCFTQRITFCNHEWCLWNRILLLKFNIFEGGYESAKILQNTWKDPLLSGVHRSLFHRQSWTDSCINIFLIPKNEIYQIEV